MKFSRFPALLLAVIAALAISTEPATAASTTFTATLSGANERPDPGDPDGDGSAIIRLDPDSGTVEYVILTNDVLTPTAAHIHRGTAEVAGDVVVNLDPDFIYNPTFSVGSAAGRVTADPALIQEIIANPAGFYVNVHNSLYPAGAVRGQLTTDDDVSDAVFPVAGAVAGANGTMFRTDLTLLNQSSEEVIAVIQFFPAGAAGNSGPAHSVTTTLLPGAQEVHENIVESDFQAAGTGAIRIVANGDLLAVARIYNDQRPVDGGTFGQFVPAHKDSNNRSNGTLPALSNVPPSAPPHGFRSNIGFFNAGQDAVTVTFNAHRPNGTILESNTLVVAPGAQQQMALSQMFSTLEMMDELYVTFTTSGGPLYVYASVVDNITGDAVFIPAH